ncbi:MAG: Crp/Fnr family transcriptional regulator [Chromatiales bacterium]|nr:Crp/Fnr family transcriptional regulator [Chromatiales bacterium]
MLTWQNPLKNRLLAQLSEPEYLQFEPQLELVMLQGGQILCEPCNQSRYGYFPVNCVVSLVGVSATSLYTPVAEIDEDGLVGLVRLLGKREIPYHCVTLISGAAYRARLDFLQAEFDIHGGFQRAALGYLQLLMIQIAQSAICIRRHSIEQKICKTLLLGMDRVAGNEVEMTQQFVANMLGLRREDVTHAARKLQDDGLLNYTRGRITILDRAGLEARVCECYRLVRQLVC